VNRSQLRVATVLLLKRDFPANPHADSFTILSTMGAHFHVELGPFTVDVQLDDSGIRMQRGPLSQFIAWEKISGATLITTVDRDESENKRDEERAAQFLGVDAAQKIHELRDKVGEIIIAYRNARDHLSETEVPAPLTDATYLQEFQSRLGERWLGESTDREQAAKRLHTNPGFFTSVFALLAIFGILAIAAGIGLFGLLGPILNFLSLQRMLLDLQDGNYSSLVSRALSYLGLFAIGYLLHRVIRAKLNAYKGRLGFRHLSQR
jgi:ABC-type multidrug transport system fused ATPase/permease subunit